MTTRHRPGVRGRQGVRSRAKVGLAAGVAALLLGGCTSGGSDRGAHGAAAPGEHAPARAGQGAEPALEPVAGRGLTVTLTDAPASRRHRSGLDPSALLVHQQDVRAVAHALWAGHAAGVTVQGRRIATPSDIRCVGNAVVVRGVPYAPPYVITAVGDPQQLRARLTADEAVANYLAMVPHGLGWRVVERTRVRLPATAVEPG